MCETGIIGKSQENYQTSRQYFYQLFFLHADFTAGKQLGRFPAHSTFVVADRSEELGEYEVTVKEVLDKVGKLGVRTRCHPPDNVEGTLI